MLSRDAVSCH